MGASAAGWSCGQSFEATKTSSRGIPESRTARLQDDASGERAGEVPDGFAPEPWHVYHAWQTAGTLAMYRAWVAGGKRMSLEEITDLAITLLCNGVNGLRRTTRT